MPVFIRFAPLLLLANAAPPATTTGPSAITYRVGPVHRSKDGRLFLNVKLWSAEQTSVLMAIPAGHAGWAYSTANGARGGAAAFRTASFDTGGDRPFAQFNYVRGSERALLRYAEAVSVPVMIDARSAGSGHALVRLVFLTAGPDNGGVWAPQQIVAPITIT